ncbi:MAG: YbdK family carboxylate-amine ligase [Marmoricola sp.]
MGVQPLAHDPGEYVTFPSGGEFTVGVEEELILVDEGGRLADRASAGLVERVRAATSTEAGTVARELFAAMIEFATPVCTNAEQIAPRLATMRSSLLAAGGHAVAAGVHPAAPFGDATLSPTARYTSIGRSLAGVLRTPTAALQVHVGLPDERAAICAYRGLRPWLPVLQALAANSPFWHGRDSGMASARWAVVSSYPRTGVPPVVTSWEQYLALTRDVVSAAQVPDYTHLWWDARLQPRYGTIEVRVMDSQPSMAVIAGLTALVQGIVRHLVEWPVDAADVPGAVLAENSFRTARHGLDTRIVDTDGSLRPVRSLAQEAVARARVALQEDGLDAPLEEVTRLLSEPPEYRRQRNLHQDSGLGPLVADLMARTARGA